MNITMILVGVGVALLVLLVGGGAAIFFWMGTKTKKISWKALVYQLGDGAIDLKKKDIKYRLSDLKPYTTDVIVKIDKKAGATHYWLNKLKKPVPVVTADCVEVWGNKEKIVRVLLQEDSCTLLKSGYDRKLGTMIFRPMDHDRINMIKTEIAERNERIENTKDILSQITPFFVAGVSILGLVVMVYFIAQGGVKMAEYNYMGTQASIKAQEAMTNKFIQGTCGQLKPIEPNITKEDPPIQIPP